MLIVNQNSFKGNRSIGYDEIHHFGEPPSLKPSLTIPGLVPSMEELVRKFVRGDSMDVFPGTFDDGVVPVGLENMDFAERVELASDVRALTDSTRARMQSRRDSVSPESKTDTQPVSIDPKVSTDTKPEG